MSIIAAPCLGFLYYIVRARIKFTGACFEVSSTFIRRHPSTLFLGPVSLVPAACWAVLASLCIYANVLKVMNDAIYDQDHVVQAKILFLTFSIYWVWQYMANTVHVIVSGAFASWYFFGSRASSVVLSSLRRGLWSAGSVAFGSLITAILQVLIDVVGTPSTDIHGRSESNIVQQLVRHANPSPQPLPATPPPVSYPTKLYLNDSHPSCQPRCGVASPTSYSSSTSAPAGHRHPTHPTHSPSPVPPALASFTPSAPAHHRPPTPTLTRYAFCYVAIYGQSFTEAGRSVFSLFERHGVKTLMSNGTTDLVLSMAVFVGAAFGIFVTAVIALAVYGTTTFTFGWIMLGGGLVSCALVYSVMSTSFLTPFTPSHLRTPLHR